MMLFLVCVLGLHLILCAGIVLAVCIGKIRLSCAAFPLAFLCLFFGPVCVLSFLAYQKKNRREAAAEPSEFPEEKAREIYRLFGFTEERDRNAVFSEDIPDLHPFGAFPDAAAGAETESVVPLEDALIVSAADVRRRLMMDILRSDTAPFYGLLEEARRNNDTEVVHYAATAMAELGKKYDTRLETYEKLHSESPGDLGILRDYCACLRGYLELGMLKGLALSVRRNTYITLLLKLNEKEETSETCHALAEQYLLTGDYEKADTLISDMEKKWRDKEEILLLRLEYAVRVGNGEQVKALADSALRRHQYLGKETRSRLMFWAGHSVRGETDS